MIGIVTTLLVAEGASAYARQTALERAGNALIGGNAIRVHCASPPEVEEFRARHGIRFRVLGWANWGTRKITLTRAICLVLLRHRTEPRFGSALTTFSHELGHIYLRSGDETRVECFAIRNVRRLAREGFGRRLTRDQVDAVIRRHLSTPEDPYRLRPC